MKTKITFFFFLFVILNFSFLILNSFAQWEADVRLTNDPANSYTASNNKWGIAANGNIIHIVWQEQRDGNDEIYYKRSIDGGTTWGADTRLTNNSANSYAPGIAVSGSQVHVIWWDNRDGNFEIYYKRSTDGGATWGADTRLTNNTSDSFRGSLSVSGSQVHVVWYDYRDGNLEIYYKRSTDGGSTWGADTRLTNSAGSSAYPSIAISGFQVHVVWYDYRDGNAEIYYINSTDGGTTWGTETRLTNNTSESSYPSIAVSGSQIHIVWQDNRNSNWMIYYKRSTDGGATWGADTQFSNNPYSAREPSIAVSGSLVYVVWEDDRESSKEIFYKNSTNGGANWTADTRLTNNIGYSLYSFVTLSGSQAHVLWTDDRDGNNEIYYKRTVPPVPSVPTLVSPVNNSSSQPLNLNLIWNKPQFALKYRVLVATDSLFANVIINDSLLTDSVKSISNLNSLAYYYWKVSAGNGNPAGWSSYSAVYKFKTIGSPTQVNLFSPANNAVNQPVSITFKWYKAIDQTYSVNGLQISNYWLEYSADSNFISGVVKDSTLTDSLKTVSGLNTATKYYWRVKAKNVIGWGSFSSIWNFTTVPPVPASPILVSPLNNAVNLQPNVLLDWNNIPYAVSYRIQIASDSLFANLVKDTSSVVPDSIRISPGILMANTKYFWRVNAINTSGTSPWSTVWNFRINPTGMIQTENEIPSVFSLSQNFPNPFNPVTKIRFAIPLCHSCGGRNPYATLKVFDILGKEVATLVNQDLQPGTYETMFDASNLTSGIYYYKLTAGNYSATKKMILIK